MHDEMLARPAPVHGWTQVGTALTSRKIQDKLSGNFRKRVCECTQACNSSPTAAVHLSPPTPTASFHLAISCDALV
jgi:hypothetical protein